MSTGATYIFVTHNNGVTWSEEQKLLASDGAAGDQYGHCAAVGGAIIAVGAPKDHNTNGDDAG